MDAAFGRIRAGNPNLADSLEKTCMSLASAGAGSAAKRLMLAIDYAEELRPEALFTLVDPDRIVQDYEEAQSKEIRRISAVRNALALMPLVLTWLALAWAATEYQQLISQDPRQVVQPFLILWQNGFGGRTPFTLTVTAALDFILLTTILVLTIWSNNAESTISVRARQIGDEVGDGMMRLVEASRAGTFVPRTADPNDWATIVQATIKTAMDQLRDTITSGLAASQKMTDEARGVVEAVGRANTDLVDQRMHPLVERFRLSVDDLKTGLDDYKNSVSTIGATITQLGTAANTLASASQALEQHAAAYTGTAVSIDNHIQQLGGTQQQFVGIVAGAAGDMTRAADAVQRLAVQINQDMVNNLATASRQLATVDTHISQTTGYLANTGKLLERVARVLDVASANALRARQGWLYWLLSGSRSASGNQPQS